MTFSPRKHFAYGIALALLALLTGGCTATYVPISWHFREKVRHMAQSDPTLEILFRQCDPKLATLRFGTASFSEVMMPGEVKHHLGAYRRDTSLIYRNLEYNPSDEELRDLLVHEIAHHCWFNAFNEKQRQEWQQHLVDNPSALQAMVRRVYKDPATYSTEDFAFVLQHARPVDIDELVAMKLITAEEGKTLLKGAKPAPALMAHEKVSAPPPGTPASADPDIDAL